MSEEAKILFGAQLNRENLTTSGTFDLKVGKITNFQLPQMSADTQDVTTTDSTGAYREFIPGLLDGGEVSIEFTFKPDDAGQVQLKTDFEARACVNYEISLPAIGGAPAAKVQFAAIITALNPPSGEISDTMKGSVTMKVSGQPTWTGW